MIGILDSGIGGLSIYYEVKKRLPEAGVVYLADNKNFPYGDKSEVELLAIVRSAVRTLIEKGATIIILACNSATVSTIQSVRTEFTIPIVGIEPAIKTAKSVTKNGKIGVLATKRTVANHEASEGIIKVHNAELVDMIEHDVESISDEVLKAAMLPFTSLDVDTVVLGCTHFSFIKDRLSQLFPAITFLEPTEAVVNRLESVISENKLDIERGSDIFLGIDESDIRKI